jgi:serine/threonine kinase 16
MDVQVLYALTSELASSRAVAAATRRSAAAGSAPRCNCFAMTVSETQVMRNPRLPEQAYVAGSVLLDAFPLIDGPAAAPMRLFVRQPQPHNPRSFMWLLAAPEEQLAVLDGVLQVQAARADELPRVAKSEAEVWWLLEPSERGAASGDSRDSHDPRRASASASSNAANAGTSSGASAAGLVGSIDTAAAKEAVASAASGAAAGLAGFASWAKKGIAKAADVAAATVASASAGESFRLRSGRSVSVVKKLAEGGFSEVFLVRDSAGGPHGERFALKRCLAQSAEDVRSLRAEMAVHKRCAGSDFVMQLLDSNEEAVVERAGMTRVVMLFPLYSDGSLYDQMAEAIKEQRAWPFPEQVAVQLAVDILSGLEALHAAGFAHRDLKPHNVLLGSLGGAGAGPLRLPQDIARARPVLMDLGSCTALVQRVGSRKEAMNVVDEAAVKSSAPYRAPELYEVPQIPFLLDEKVDVWSFGTSLFAMTFGKCYSPFEHPTQGLLTLAIHQAAVKWPAGSEFSPALQRVLERTMAKDAAERPTVAELKGLLLALAQR